MMKALPPHRRIHQKKLVSTYVGVKTRMLRRQQAADHNCPVCLHERQTNCRWQVQPETVDHIFTCSASPVRDRWNVTLAALEDWLKDYPTDPSLITAILSGLRSWIFSTPAVAPNSPSPLYDLQSSLGWNNFFTGRPANSWADAQDSFLRTLPQCYKTGKRWLTQLLLHFQAMSWDFWEARNGILHHASTGVYVDELRSRVRAEFTLGFPSTNSTLARLFRPGLTIILQRNRFQLEQWLHSVMAHRADSTDSRDDRILRRQRQLIHSYFHLS